MTGRAHDLAALDLRGEAPEPHSTRDERRNVRLLGTDVVELEHDRICFAAVRAWRASQEVEDVRLGRRDAPALQVVRTPAMAHRIVDVVAAEARAAPPLATVEVARRLRPVAAAAALQRLVACARS